MFSIVWRKKNVPKLYGFGLTYFFTTCLVTERQTTYMNQFTRNVFGYFHIIWSESTSANTCFGLGLMFTDEPQNSWKRRKYVFLVLITDSGICFLWKMWPLKYLKIFSLSGIKVQKRSIKWNMYFINSQAVTIGCSESVLCLFLPLVEWYTNIT